MCYLLLLIEVGGNKGRGVGGGVTHVVGESRMFPLLMSAAVCPWHPLPCQHCRALNQSFTDCEGESYCGQGPGQQVVEGVFFRGGGGFLNHKVGACRLILLVSLGACAVTHTHTIPHGLCPMVPCGTRCKQLCTVSMNCTCGIDGFRGIRGTHCFLPSPHAHPLRTRPMRLYSRWGTSVLARTGRPDTRSLTRSVLALV